MDPNLEPIWLNKALAHSGMGKAELARQMTELLGRTIDRAAVQKMTITAAKKGKKPRRIKADELIAIAEITGYPLPENENNRYFAKGLRLWGEVKAGSWTEITENQDPKLKRIPVAPDPGYPAEAQYALRISGTSVNKTAPDGAIVICVDVIAAGIEVMDDDLVWVERRRGNLVETTLKRVRRNGKTVELWPDSIDPDHQKPIKMGLKGDEVTIRGLVISVVQPIPRGKGATK